MRFQEDYQGVYISKNYSYINSLILLFLINPLYTNNPIPITKNVTPTIICTNCYNIKLNSITIIITDNFV